MYYKDGKYYLRVTEVLSGYTCEQIAYNVVHHISENLIANAITIPGTLVHWKIEDFLYYTAELGPADPVYYNIAEQSIIDEWIATGQIQDRLVLSSEDGFEGFIKFYNTFKYLDDNGQEQPGLVPVLIEHKMFVEDFMGTGHNVAGTCDLMARVWLNGFVTDKGLFRNCPHQLLHDPLCKCEYMWVGCIMDWKFSKSKQKTHQWQMSTYRQSAEETGALDFLTKQGEIPMHEKNWSLLFNTGIPGESGFQHFQYDQDITHFLRGLRVFDDPMPTSYDTYRKKLGLHLPCMFCAYPLNCSDRKQHSQDQTVLVGEMKETMDMRYD